MNNEKRDRLEVHGWRYGSTTEFLELIPEEVASVETTLRRNRASRTGQHSQVPAEKALAPSKTGATAKRARNIR